MPRSTLVLLVLCAACQDSLPATDAGVVDSSAALDSSDGSTPDAPDTSSQDATTEAEPSDAGSLPDGPLGCDLAKPFGTPVAVSGLSRSNRFENGAHLSADELTAYVIESDPPDAGNGIGLFIVTRPTFYAPFDKETKLPFNPPSYSPYDPFVTSDGLTLYFTDPNVHLSRTTRANTSTPFDLSSATSVPTVNSAKRESQPFIASDGALWFSSDRADAFTNFDLYRAAANGSGFDAPVQVTELNSSPAYDDHPVLMPDRKTIYFASSRALLNFPSDVWMATRASDSDPFSSPVIVSALNSGATDEPDWISPDGCRLYLTSNRNGSSDIFVATRPQ